MATIAFFAAVLYTTATVDAFAVSRLPVAHSKMRQSTRIFLEGKQAFLVLPGFDSRGHA